MRWVAGGVKSPGRGPDGTGRGSATRAGATTRMANRPLTDEQRRALWARHHPAAAARAAAGVGRPRRRPARVAYDRATVAVRITHPGGGCRTAAVYAHDLSPGGLSFLYPGFLHAGTAISVALRRRAGGEAVAHGAVVWCRHVGGLWHGVGVSFAAPVVPSTFVDPADTDAVETGTPAVAAPAAVAASAPAAAPTAPTEVKPDPAVVAGRRGGLVGRVLYLDDQELDQGLFLHTVRQTRLKVTTVDDVSAALTTAAAGDFDVVCVDLNLGPRQPTGERAMAELRAAGYAGPFVVVTDEEDEARLDRAQAAGEGGTTDTLLVPKPYTAATLLAALAAALAGSATPDARSDAHSDGSAPAGGPVEADPIRSQMDGQDGMTPLLRGFCDRARAAAADLDRLLGPPDRAGRPDVTDGRGVVAVRQVCQMLRGAGRGYGFPSLSAAADEALSALEDGGASGLVSAAAELRALQSVCRRVEA